MSVSNNQDVVDSRDILEAITELEDTLDGGSLDEESCTFLVDGVDYDSEYAELVTLKELVEEASGSPDWVYGEALIADSYFVEYSKQLAEDIGAISSDSQWPLSYIDWGAAAEALKQDYFSVDWDGEEFWIRA